MSERVCAVDYCVATDGDGESEMSETIEIGHNMVNPDAEPYTEGAPISAGYVIVALMLAALAASRRSRLDSTD